MELSSAPGISVNTLDEQSCRNPVNGKTWTKHERGPERQGMRALGITTSERNGASRRPLNRAAKARDVTGRRDGQLTNRRTQACPYITCK